MRRRPKRMPTNQRKAMFARLYADSQSSRTSRPTHTEHFRSTRPKFVDPRVTRFIQSDASFNPKTDGIKIPKKKKVEEKSKVEQPSPIKETIKKIPKDNVVGLVALGASIATGNPLPLMAYKTYKFAERMDNLSKRMEDIKLKEELKDITKKNLESVGQKTLEKKTEEISKKVTEQSQDAGLIRTLSEVTHFNENATKLLFQSSIQDTIDGGIGNATSLVVDAIL